MNQSINLLEAITDNQKEDMVRDREMVDNLESNNKNLQSYKQAYLDKKVECDQFELKINGLETELRNSRDDYLNEKDFGAILKREIRELKDKVAEYESLKKEYMNNLGVSKLGLSSLNFSKMFQHDGTGGTSIPVSIPVSKSISRMVSNRESVVKVSTKTNTIPESTIFMISDKREVKDSAPQVNFFAVEDAMDKKKQIIRDSSPNPYMSLKQSLMPQGSLRVSNSRISNLLLAIGGYANGEIFNIKQDFMGMSSDPKVISELAKLGDDIEANRCYSDTMFLFSKTFKKTRFIVVVTKYSISFFNLRKNKLMKLYLLKSLKGVTISANNFTLCVLHFENQADLLIESYRRLELVSYIN